MYPVWCQAGARWNARGWANKQANRQGRAGGGEEKNGVVCDACRSQELHPLSLEFPFLRNLGRPFFVDAPPIVFFKHDVNVVLWSPYESLPQPPHKTPYYVSQQHPSTTHTSSQGQASNLCLHVPQMMRIFDGGGEVAKHTRDIALSRTQPSQKAWNAHKVGNPLKK